MARFGKFKLWLAKIFGTPETQRLAQEKYDAWQAEKNDYLSSISAAHQDRLKQLEALEPSSLSGEEDYMDIYNSLGRGNSFGSSILAKWFGFGLTDAEKATNALNMAEAQRAREWDKQLADTQYQRGVIDMQKAGLNPALMFGSASPAPSPSSPVATGVSPSSGGVSFQDMLSLLTLPMQLSQMSANVAATRASAQNIAADTQSKSLDNVWKERTLDTRVRAAELQNNLTETDIKFIDDQRSQIRQNIENLKAQAKTEAERTFLVAAQKGLADAQATQIAALLPYQQLLAAAQTTNQQASACASFMNAMYQRHMLDKGMIEVTIDTMYQHAAAARTSAAAAAKQADTAAAVSGSQIAANNAAARSSNSASALNEFKSSVFHGTSFSEEGDLSGLGSFFNDLTATFSSLATSIGGPLAGVLK